ncbi:uncharacterized protein FPRO_11239 [Fusarium proliferatum ET1]|uniref:Zn(2)-C6 fungal-type domain-containing protein n=1 Tax=Fusarium proliferatum (strain ET1) TaxID=1227346 RepID=A0A1L7VPP6_FUSPR|nr:uncharacterized protein FPRO_11239 [Fusarium proliferatum ET1]CZR41650.1 uncharacterized protein FPRO_11239 [Fusarium proliferatum ET1]
MDAQGSSRIREKYHPETITSTGLSVIYVPETEAAIVDIIMVHGLKGHPYKTWRCKKTPENEDQLSINPDKEAPKSSTSKRLEFRQSIKAFLKGSSSNRQDSSYTDSTINDASALENGDGSVFWPADLLPQICKRARILTFGYDTKITKFISGPTNTNSIFSHGKDFLFSLARECVPDRPIIFIAHSLGGILVKEMLALSSNSDTPTQKGVIKSTAAVMFLGTPHRGSPELSAIGEWARSMLSSLKFQTTSTILDSLGLKTTDLERAHEAFCRLWHQYDFQVKTFQESFGLTGIDLGVLGNKVVPHESSLIGDPREHAETLQANHKQMSRFSNAQDPNYIKVSGEIKALYTAIENAQNRNQFTAEPTKLFKTPSSLPHPLARLSCNLCRWRQVKCDRRNPCSNCISHNRQCSYAAGYDGAAKVPTETEADRNDILSFGKTYPDILGKNELDDFLMTLLFGGMNTRQDSVVSPAINTGQWLFQDPTFRLWTTATDPKYRLLFLKGKPGAGKSTLMKEAVRQMHYVQSNQGICASFFVDAGGELLQGSSAGIFRSLLYQLLSQSGICSPFTEINMERDILISSIKGTISSNIMPSVEWGERPLQSLLTQTLRYLASLDTPVYIFVDALDELGAKIQREQVDFWGLQQLYPQGPRICLSCRHFPNIVVAGCLELVLDMYNGNDILTYTTQRLNTRMSTKEKHWRTLLTKKIHSLSSGSFLWTVLVVDEILARYDEGASLPVLMRRVKDMPTELEELYKKMLTTTEYEDSLLIGRMFEWVFAANRLLRLDEWHHILAFIQPSKPASLATWRKSNSFTENDDQLERKIKNLSRGLLEVSNKQHDVLAEKNGEVSSINAGAGSLDHEEGSARVVRVIHRSVYDFFIYKGGFRSLGLESVNPLLDCHCTIANTCIDYLFIPELDEYVVARQRVNMASLVSASLCSETSLRNEEPPNVEVQRQGRGSGRTFEGLEALPPWQPFEVVESWLAGGVLPSYAGSIPGSTKRSASHESLVAATSQVLSDYPALLVYAITEVMLHVELAELDLNPTQKTQHLLERLGDDGIWKRLRALQQERRSRKKTAEWLEAVAQNRLPPLSK